MSDHDTTSQVERDGWRGIDIALDLLNQWYEANMPDWDEDEETPLGPTMGDMGNIIACAQAVAVCRGVI